MDRDGKNTGGARWRAVCPLAELAPERPRAFKREGARLVVGRGAGGEVFALDNRCPHEGYPLHQGTLKGELLTCAWHNWKFDVRDGTCVLGGEDARRFPVRVRDGEVEVDLAEPDPAELFPRWKESLARGIFEHDLPRAVRDGLRLLRGGYGARELLADVARYDALHAEYGSSHVLALSADALRYLGRLEGLRSMHAIAHVIDLCGETNRRLAPRARPEPVPGASAEALREAVEAEEAERAEALVRGALEGGVGRGEVERWVYGCLSDHFLDFGHQLIYHVKGQELFSCFGDAAAGNAVARDVLPSLVYAVTLGTREDTLPYLSPVFDRLREIEGELADLHERSREDAARDLAGLTEVALDGSVDEAFGELLAALRAGAGAGRIARALVVAAAERLFRFDAEIDRSPELEEGWLWATHRLTFASAARNAVERFDSPDRLRFLFQALAFVRAGRPLDAPPERHMKTHPAGEGSGGDTEDLRRAVLARDAEAAVALASGFLQAGELVALRAVLEDLSLEDRYARPIVTTHAIKTTCAALEEHAALAGLEGRDLPVLAAVRFLASPAVERSVGGVVAGSIGWVGEGRLPRKLIR